MADQDRTYAAAGVRYGGITRERVRQLFKRFDLPTRSSTIPDGKKWCSGCKTIKPVEEFYNRHSRCKACSRRASRRALPPERRTRLAYFERLRRRGLKECPNCKRILDRIEGFHRNTSGDASTLCRPCNSKKASAWAQVRPEVVARRNNQRRIQTQVDDATAHDAWVIVLRDDCCCYCGRRGKQHIDHVDPLSRGGSPEWHNLTGACQSCNSSKRDKPLLEFMLAQTTNVVYNST